MRQLIDKYDQLVAQSQNLLTPLMLLGVRFWAAEAFFRAGQVKIANWDSTLFLFEYEYQVPLLPFETAAVMASIVELCLPPLLALGLFSRPVALVLFGFNAMAVISYPVLWEQGFLDHQLWGLMLLMTVLLGPGRWSVDQFLRNRWLPSPQPQQQQQA
ncbi:DoxX family protein [Motiliproteus coralliicola]|uniref:DoxX family protein n=1 Tax=Motiliproteus coralliicola TaxID=2283196 RepID=A0A369WSP0_9GAMM|nr:DoxX family protein [Motiliproteus coralliicola]RDE24183.1 DoxX family protein [Motiliproteus coralliicola]